MKKFILILPFLLQICLYLPAQQTIAPGEFSLKITKDVSSGYYDNGQMLYKTGIKNSSLHGSWKSWYQNNSLLDSGTFHQGYPDGAWKAWYPDGTTRYYREYSADKWQRFQQQLRWFHPRRPAYPITKLYYQNNSRGNKYLTANTSFCNAADCKRNAVTGLAGKTMLNASGEHYHPVFENGFLHGLCMNFFPGGNVQDSGYYQNGLPEGLWVHWTADGKSYWQGVYQHGKRIKEWKLYAAQGRLLRITRFKNGAVAWTKEISSF